MDAYCGLPRAGKSYGVVKHVIIPAVREGRTVWTNIPLNLDVWRERFPLCDLTVFDVADVEACPDWFQSVLPAGSVLVLDEAWRLWPSGVKANQLPQPHREFLAMHGHRVDDQGRAQIVVLVTQDLSQLCAFVRQLVSKTFRVVKLDMLGADKNYQVNVYQGPVTGDRPPKDKKISQHRGTIEPAICELYRSHTQSVDGLAGDETRLDARVSIWSQRWLRFLPGVLAIGAFLVWFTLHRLGGQASPSAPVVREVPAEQFPAIAQAPLPVPVSASQSLPAAPPAPAPVSVPSLPESARWRVAGWVEGRDGAQVVLTDGTYTRLRPLGDGGCTRDAFGEVSCTLGSELVTQYSGRTDAPLPPATDSAIPDTMLASAGSALLKNLGLKPAEGK